MSKLPCRACKKPTKKGGYCRSCYNTEYEIRITLTLVGWDAFQRNDRGIMKHVREKVRGQLPFTNPDYFSDLAEPRS